jgi:hypothetical protein
MVKYQVKGPGFRYHYIGFPGELAYGGSWKHSDEGDGLFRITTV